MKWQPIANAQGLVTHWRRDCGRYFVDHAEIPGSKTGKRYCAWFKSHESALAQLIDCKDDLREATEACSDHIRSHKDSSPEGQESLAL